MSTSLVHALRSVARESPEVVALGWRETRWTYRQLIESIDAAANTFAASGAPAGARIAILLRNSPQYVALYFGALAAGHVAVPLNPQERANVLARQIEHCGASLLVGDPEHPEWQALCDSPPLRHVRTLPVALTTGSTSTSDFVRAFGASTAPVSFSPSADMLAAIIYTSGTTGRPKGVMLSHGNLLSNTRAIIQYLELTANDRGLCVLPFQFSYGSSVLHTHLLAGAYLSIEENFAFPQATLQRLQNERITGFAGVPSTFTMLLGRCKLEDFDLSSLRYVTQAGGPMPTPVVAQLRAQLPRARLFIMYGQTEATARIAYLPPERLDATQRSVGIAIDGVQIEVRAENRATQADEIGEIVVRGPNVMLGYWNDAEATAAVLRDGWLYTGDLGHRDADGFLYIDGRAVDMIKVGAFRVSPLEVEEVVAALPGVEEVAVVGVLDELLGQAIKAIIVARAGAEPPAPMAVKAHCRQHLASYKVPKIVEIAATLPRTMSGKVQKFKLKEEIHS